MTRKFFIISFMTLSACIAISHPVWCQASQNTKNEMIQSTVVTGDTIKDVKVSLIEGLSIAEKEGKAISAKFEFADGVLQLSIYTTKDNKFFEVIVDHKTGKISKIDPITEGDDLKVAKSQADAVGKAKRTLQQAALQTMQDNKGSSIISVLPSLMGGHPVAGVTFGIGADVQEAMVKLD
jgi:hypothetical protein